MRIRQGKTTTLESARRADRPCKVRAVSLTTTAESRGVTLVKISLPAAGLGKGIVTSDVVGHRRPRPRVSGSQERPASSAVPPRSVRRPRRGVGTDNEVGARRPRKDGSLRLNSSDPPRGRKADLGGTAGGCGWREAGHRVIVSRCRHDPARSGPSLPSPSPPRLENPPRPHTLTAS